MLVHMVPRCKLTSVVRALGISKLEGRFEIQRRLSRGLPVFIVRGSFRILGVKLRLDRRFSGAMP